MRLSLVLECNCSGIKIAMLSNLSSTNACFDAQLVRSGVMYFDGQNSWVRKKQRIKTPAHVIVLIAIMFSLDGIDLIYRNSAPQKLNNFACSFLGYLDVLSGVMSHDLVLFAQYGCAAVLQEPGVSIIFYMAKIAASLLVALYFFIDLLFRPHFLSDKIAGYFQSGTRLAVVAKNEIFPSFVLALIFAFLQLNQNVSVQKYRVDILGKFFENLACLVLFALLARLIGGICVFVSCAIKKLR